jgi:CHASE2 domain-containing sensor protein
MRDPERMILAVLVVTGGIVTWRGLRAGKLSPRTYAGLAVLALLLLALGTFVPKFAAAFALLVLVVVLLSSVQDLESLMQVTRIKG